MKRRQRRQRRQKHPIGASKHMHVHVQGHTKTRAPQTLAGHGSGVMTRCNDSSMRWAISGAPHAHDQLMEKEARAHRLCCVCVCVFFPSHNGTFYCKICDFVVESPHNRITKINQPHNTAKKVRGTRRKRKSNIRYVSQHTHTHTLASTLLCTCERC